MFWSKLRIRPVLYSIGGLTTLTGSLLAVTSQAVQAQQIECHFSQPVRIIRSIPDLPPPVHDALIKDGMIADMITSTAGPFFINAGQLKDVYFVWSSRGDRPGTDFISLYRTVLNGGAPILLKRVSGLFAGANWTRWCSNTADLLNLENEPASH
jgi:hypothetical protein